jgi:hypothetical protein
MTFSRKVRMSHFTAINHIYTKHTIPEEGSGSHRTTGDFPLHISLHIAFQWCARLDQAQDIPHPLPPMARAIRNNLNKLRRARSEPSRGV